MFFNHLYIFTSMFFNPYSTILSEKQPGMYCFFSKGHDIAFAILNVLFSQEFTLNCRFQVYHTPAKRTWQLYAMFANPFRSAQPTSYQPASPACSTRWTTPASPSASTDQSTVSTLISTHSCAKRSPRLYGLAYRYV